MNERKFLPYLPLHKRSLGGDVGSMEQGKGYWNPTFLRHFNVWEKEDVERLLLWLKEKKVSEQVEDTIW